MNLDDLAARVEKLEQAQRRTITTGTTTELNWTAEPLPDPEHGGIRPDKPPPPDPPDPPDPVQMANKLSQFGITWTFDREHEVGNFANGDWWVVGPVTVTSISPVSLRAGGRITHGSMLNPRPSGRTQGYDSAMYGQYKSEGDYSNEMNVARQLTIEIPTGSSLVSTISLSTLETGQKETLQTAAVLTVLMERPPEGSFRPAYAGLSKVPRFTEDELHYPLLPRFAPVGEPPAFAEAERWFERPWLDHVALWIGGYIHPSDNMPNYGREIADQVGRASLLLCLDVPDTRKRNLLVRLVQYGIDCYGILERKPKHWQGSAGWMHGRKWPILFAGLMLGDPKMMGIGADPVNDIGEDSQTFYVKRWGVGGLEGPINGGYGGYEPQHLGMPEWGSTHSWKPKHDNVLWNEVGSDPYRLCCSANVWWGELLAARLMGAKQLWNHDALFDYQDRFLEVNDGLVAEGKLKPWQRSWTPWPLAMWRAYR